MYNKLDIQLYKIAVTAKGTLNKASKGMCSKGMSPIWSNGLSSEAGEQPGLEQSSSEGMTKGNPKQFQPLFRSGSSNDGPTPLLSLEKEKKRKKAEAQRGASPVQSQSCSRSVRGQGIPRSMHALSWADSQTLELFTASASFTLAFAAPQFCHSKDLAVAFKIVILL